MELKKIVKSTSFLIGSKIFQFFISLIKAKLGAVYLGTSGIGIYNQVQHLTSFVSRITLLSMNDGLVKLIAQNKREENFKDIFKGLIKSYTFLILFSVLLAFAICLVFAKPLTIFFLGDYKYLNYYLWGVGGVPLLIINSISFGVLKGYKATKQISRANILGGIISLSLFIPLVYFFNILGAVIVVFLNFATLLVINFFQARRLVVKDIKVSLSKIFRVKTNKKHTKELLMFAAFGASSGLIYFGAESVCRSIVVNMLGVDQLGLYAPIIAWSGLLTGFILPSIQVYLYPRYGESKTKEEIGAVLNDFFYLVTLLMVPFIFFAISYRNILIPLFYTEEFIEATKYLPWHFMGIAFFMWWQIFTLVLTPTGKIKIHALLTTLMAISNIAIVYFLVPKIGLYGWMLKFIISPVVFLTVTYFYLRHYIKLKLKIRNVILMVYLLGFSLLLVAIEAFDIKYFVPFILVGILPLFMTPRERKIVRNKVKSILHFR